MKGFSTLCHRDYLSITLGTWNRKRAVKIRTFFYRIDYGPKAASTSGSGSAVIYLGGDSTVALANRH